MVYLFLSSPRLSTLLFEATAQDRQGQQGWHVVTTAGGKDVSHLPHQGWTLGSMASRIAKSLPSPQAAQDTAGAVCLQNATPEPS